MTAYSILEQAPIREGVEPAQSIREAARQLNVASSAVNRQILALEQELGTPIFERLTLQLRAESFNILNHPNFANPDSTFEDANFGKITAINSSSSPREFQFAGRLSF